MRDWRRLPYWGTDVALERSVGELYTLLMKAGVQAYRVTQQPPPAWKLMVEWEQKIGEAVVVVSFDIAVDQAELRLYTERQQEQIRKQAARLMWHTIKNLIAAHEAGLISMNELFLAKMQTYQNGHPVNVGHLVMAQIETAGQLGPAIIQRALPAGGQS
jgi:hypothetical protein